MAEYSGSKLHGGNVINKPYWLYWNIEPNTVQCNTQNGLKL